MREIIFRGKRVDNGAWVEGFYTMTSFGNGFSPSIIVFNGGSTMPHKVLPETVGQYTGLKDRNGKMIFEGDIVTGYYHNLRVDYSGGGVVEWGYTSDSDGFECGETVGWVLSNGSSLADVVHSTYPREEENSTEIIGNIHENPKLQEVFNV